MSRRKNKSAETSMIGSNMLVGKANKEVLYPVRNNGQLLFSGDKNYSFPANTRFKAPFEPSC
jgi:hypothetical protein